MFYVRALILPDSPGVILRGEQSEASSQPLSGRVVFHLGHSLKVSKVTIAFQSVGSSKQQIRLHSTSKRVLFEHNLFNASNYPKGYVRWYSRHTHNYPEEYEYPFSITIPGNIEESIHTDFGRICYELKVTIFTCGFGINTWTESLKVPVYRLSNYDLQHTISLNEPLCVQSNWLDIVRLQILGDTAAIADNSKLHARIVVQPLQKGLNLVDIGVSLSETVHSKSLVDRFGDPRKSSKIIYQRQQTTGDTATGGLPLLCEHYFDLVLHIPKAFTGVQYTMNTARLRVVHELVLTATVVDKHREPHHLRLSSFVCIVPSAVLINEISNLPAYCSTRLDRLLLSSNGRSTASSLPPPSYQQATCNFNTFVA
ncbi:hypothetical protein COEREDRAFT_14793 [Coemansia reversa NRRL 1564]|uniref:Arrestin-like N-terminal domain-containing protein n=1 Tax=Coemansia reversa (strain ATCC 12441 / NRRL 1564) TaxID=763665 RepID=A0A2G5BE98_COERN|nr:hypothetical protein COEREDRAFT_14793 [Coemansia reversa NRRL 1564]|eukprot:PIA17335.1 hypothetical protein COEREDRAFT_14793 [Coemansia reversa NRRL 1564]